MTSALARPAGDLLRDLSLMEFNVAVTAASRLGYQVGADPAVAGGVDGHPRGDDLVEGIR